MSAFKIILAVAVVGSAVSLPVAENIQPHYQEHHEEPSYKEEAGKPYKFDYGVRDDYSGANYGHSEASDGDAITGSYKVLLPDGRVQTVRYVADHKNGFQAEVTYEGEAKFPEEKSYQPKEDKHQDRLYSRQEPRYEQPQPTYKEAPVEEPIYHPSQE